MQPDLSGQFHGKCWIVTFLSIFGEVLTYSCGYKFCSFTLAKATWVGCIAHPSRKSGGQESRDALRLARYAGGSLWRGGWSDRHEGAGGVWTRHLCFVSRMLWTQICPWIVLWDACGLAMVAFETRHGKEKMENEKKLESKLTAQSGQRMRLATASFLLLCLRCLQCPEDTPLEIPERMKAQSLMMPISQGRTFAFWQSPLDGQCGPKRAGF